jgi:hypothetical protein
VKDGTPRSIEHGILPTALLIYSLRLAYWLGVPPERLKSWFRDARGKQKNEVFSKKLSLVRVIFVIHL